MQILSLALSSGFSVQLNSATPRRALLAFTLPASIVNCYVSESINLTVITFPPTYSSTCQSFRQSTGSRLITLSSKQSSVPDYQIERVGNYFAHEIKDTRFMAQSDFMKLVESETFFFFEIMIFRLFQHACDFSRAVSSLGFYRFFLENCVRNSFYSFLCLGVSTTLTLFQCKVQPRQKPRSRWRDKGKIARSDNYQGTCVEKYWKKLTSIVRRGYRLLSNCYGAWLRRRCFSGRGCFARSSWWLFEGAAWHETFGRRIGLSRCQGQSNQRPIVATGVATSVLENLDLLSFGDGQFAGARSCGVIGDHPRHFHDSGLISMKEKNKSN